MPSFIDYKNSIEPQPIDNTTAFNQLSMRLLKIAVVLLIGITASIGFMACADAEHKARELYDLAQFEEKQFNCEHALVIYNDIKEDYPATNMSQKAQQSIDRLKKSNECSHLFEKR